MYVPPEVVAVNLQIIPLDIVHFQQVAKIYQEGLDTGLASFETTVPTWEQFNYKFLKACRLVAIMDKKVVGWCALSKVSKREVYKGVAEVTLYIAKAKWNQNLGNVLFSRLILESEKLGYWTLQSSIFEANEASIKLHIKQGFRVVGYREKIAQRNGVWHNTLLLERRTKKI